MRWAVVLLVLAGCTSSPAGPDDAVPPAPEAADAPDPGAVPSWEAGRSWTYATEGYWDTPDTVTVVAVNKEGDWLLAGAGPEDLIDDVAWDHHPFGPVDLLANEEVLITFPLDNGTTWTLWGQRMRAEAARIAWSGGTEQGFRASDGAGLLVEYAPSAGYVTRYESRDSAGELEFGLRLVATGTASEWTTFNRLDEGIASGGSATSLLSVPADADEVIAWMLASEGARQFVQPPGAPATLYEGHGGRSYGVDRFPAAEGEWLFGGAAAGGDTYMQLHAVQWITSR